MPYSYPFTPMSGTTVRTALNDTVKKLDAPSSNDSLTLYVDNRGSTDVLLEIGKDPTDTGSFPIPAGMSQPIGIGFKRDIRLKRPAGATAEEVVTTFGRGA